MLVVLVVQAAPLAALRLERMAQTAATRRLVGSVATSRSTARREEKVAPSQGRAVRRSRLPEAPRDVDLGVPFTARMAQAETVGLAPAQAETRAVTAMRATVRRPQTADHSAPKAQATMAGLAVAVAVAPALQLAALAGLAATRAEALHQAALLPRVEAPAAAEVVAERCPQTVRRQGPGAPAF